MTIYLLESISSATGYVQVRVHESHSAIRNGYNVECHNCWGCSCHSSDILALPCLHTVETDVRPPGVADAVAKQAHRYGEQIRLLESAGRIGDSIWIKAAWKAFRNQLCNTSLLSVAICSYNEAYEQ